MSEVTARSASGNSGNSHRGRWKPYPAYRHSGVDWLGEVPEHWETKRLRYLLSRNDGGAWGDDDDPEGILVLRSTEQTLDGGWRIDDPARRSLSSREIRDCSLRPGDLVVTKSSGSASHIGKTSLVTEEVAALQPCFSNFMQRLRFSEACVPRLGWYLLNCPAGRQQLVFNSNTTTGLANLNGSVLGNVITCLPPLPEQRSIAAFLDRETAKLDTLVAKKRELIQLLKEKRSALISQAVTKGLDPSAPTKDSGIEWIGEVPEHWEVLRLKHLLKPRKGAIKTGPFGSQLQSWEMVGGDIKVYNQKSVITQDIGVGDDYIFTDKFEELKAFEVFVGDLLVTTRGTIGRCMVVPEQAERGILHPCLMRIQLERALVTNRYAEILIQDSGRVLDQLQLMSNATTIDVIYSESLKEVWVPIPPLPEQTAIVDYVDRETAKLDQMAAKVEEAVERLQEYRTALITAAVTGKTDVRGAGVRASF